MFALPSLIGHELAMKTMEELHLNYSWGVILAAVVCLFFGFVQIGKKLILLIEGIEKSKADHEAESAVRLAIASMDRSEDIYKVVDEIKAQIKRLGLEHDSCSIQVVDPQGTGFALSTWYLSDGTIRSPG